MIAGRPLHVSLLPTGRAELAGQALRTVGGAHAALQLKDDGPELSFSLPPLCRAEVRWVLERLVRGLSTTLSYNGIRLTISDEIDSDTALALALDLHRRAGGDLTVTPEEISTEVTRVEPYESIYRAWIDEDPATRTSLAIAADVEALVAECEHVSAEVYAEPWLVNKGLRLLLAVGGGSEASPPRLCIANYRPPGTEGKKPLMLIGKGITFDSGGINVKPYESFVSMMKNDMGGAALAFALFKGLVESDHPHPVSLVIPTCENAIGPRSMRPGSLVKSYRGPMVRIDHTDAEGRLVLADGLAYASEVLDPEQIICFATLTTAALIAYGPFATPVHFATGDLADRLKRASEECGEDLHFFPERIWHLEANRDKEADLRNTARLPGHAVRGAGSRNAAHFLRHFTDHPLVHLDIFASTWNWSGEAPGGGYGATGAPLRTLLRALRELSPG